MMHRSRALGGTWLVESEHLCSSVEAVQHRLGDSALITRAGKSWK